MARPGRNWHLMTDEQLLEMRLCDLPVRIEKSPLEGRIKRLYSELDSHSFRFRPHVWLSSEWFSPDGVPGFAVPFYLTHPRLTKLERNQMLEVEGGTDVECMRILRHEAGHALDNAYRLHFRRRWRELFGSFTQPYPDSYKPKPNSRNYVLHLGAWYAQSHPAEDFAETFAVWLSPRSRWRRRYQGWSAMKKLEYVDELMQEIVSEPVKNWRRRRIEPLSEMKLTLGEHYERKREYYTAEWPAFYDRDLRRIFSQEKRHASRPTATLFMRRARRELRQIVAEGTGVHQYTIDYVLKHMIERCKELRLRVVGSEAFVKRQAMIMLTVHTMNIVHSGQYRIAL